MKHLTTALFVIPGIINFIPVIGVFSNERLAQLYQIDPLDTDLALLLRHRAVLLGIVGALLIVSAFQIHIRTQATIAGMISMVSFLVLMAMLEISNPALVKVAWMDVLAIAMLALGYLLHVRNS